MMNSGKYARLLLVMFGGRKWILAGGANIDVLLSFCNRDSFSSLYLSIKTSVSKTPVLFPPHHQDLSPSPLQLKLWHGSETTLCLARADPQKSVCQLRSCSPIPRWPSQIDRSTFQVQVSQELWGIQQGNG